MKLTIKKALEIQNDERVGYSDEERHNALAFLINENFVKIENGSLYVKPFSDFDKKIAKATNKEWSFFGLLDPWSRNYLSAVGIDC